MKRLLFVILIASGAWFALWFVGAASMKSGVADWFDGRRDAGWAADYGALDVRGFPNRLDVFLTDPVVADPKSGIAWQADKLDVLALSYKKNHMIVVFPETQTIATPFGKYQIDSENMRASLVVDPSRNKAVMRANLVAESTGIAAENANTIQASQLRIGINELEGANSYRLAIIAEDLRPPFPNALKIQGDSPLPDTFETFGADINVTFDSPWDQTAAEEKRPQPTQIDVTMAEAKWGGLHLQMAGKLSVDNDGWPTGQLVVKAKNWREMLTLARETGTIGDGFVDLLDTSLGMLSALSGNKSTLDLPLEFRNKRVFLGPAPVGAAPRLRLR